MRINETRDQSISCRRGSTCSHESQPKRDHPLLHFMRDDLSLDSDGLLFYNKKSQEEREREREFARVTL